MSATADDFDECKSAAPDRSVRGCTKLIERGNLSSTVLAQVFNQRGLSRAKMKQWDLAIADYTRAIQFDPDAPWPRYNRGWVYVQKSEHARAIIDLESAIALKPLPEYYVDLGVAYDRTGRGDLAIVNYTRAIEMRPTYALAYYNRGVAHFTRENIEAAIRDFNDAIAYDPQYARPYVMRARARILKRDYGSAVLDLDEAVRLNPADAEALFDRARAFSFMGKYREAVIDATKSISLQPKMLGPLINRGVYYLKLGEYDQAIQNLDRALVLGDRGYVVRYNRALAHAAKGNFGDAEQDINAAISLTEIPAAFFVRSLIRERLGKREESERDFAHALELANLVGKEPFGARSLDTFLKAGISPEPGSWHKAPEAPSTVPSLPSPRKGSERGA